MRLSIYLFQDGVSFDSALREKYRGGGADAYSEVHPSGELGFACRAFVVANKAKPPKWERWLAEAFDLGRFALKNQSSSFVLLLEAEGRLFAATFGYGWTAIERARVEPDFGLKVTLNQVDPVKLDMLDTRTVDLVTRQERIHLNVGSPVAEFGVNTDLDWVRAVSGRPLSPEFAKRMGGSDSLVITWDGTAQQLGEKCGELLGVYRQDTYRTHFAFVDQMRILGKHEPVISVLDERLRALVTSRETTKLAVAYPDFPSDEIVEYTLLYGRAKRSCDELDLGEVYWFLDEHCGGDVDLGAIQVLGLNQEGEARTQKTKLRMYLVAEVEHGGETFLHSLGRWFRVDPNYVAAVHRKLHELDDVTSELALPNRHRAEREDEYNRRVEAERGWLSLDKKMFTFGSPTEKIEACDLVTPNLDLLCVKDMKASATLSHLFGQGSVSARLLRADDRYRQKFEVLVQTRWPGSPLDVGGARVVYAISTKRPGTLADSLFFFSQVNLLQHVDAIRGAGFRVALCRIEQEAP